jgi:hypothetical protein
MRERWDEGEEEEAGGRRASSLVIARLKLALGPIVRLKLAS